MSITDDDMVLGYMDGSCASSPDPSDDRSANYREGFAGARDDLARRPITFAAALREQLRKYERFDEMK